MHVVQVNYAYNAALTDPDELLEDCSTLTGWSDAVLSAGAARVSVVQRFSRDVRLERNGVAYLFVADSGPAFPRCWTSLRRLHETGATLRPDVAHVNGLIFPFYTRMLRRVLPGTAFVLQHHAEGCPDDRVRRAIRRGGLAVADAFLFAAAELA